MNNFYYHIPTEVYFGRGQIEQLGKAVKKYGKKVLLVYGGGSIKRIGLYDAIKGVLEQNKTENIELSSVEPNPRIESVYLGVELCKRKMVDVILAVGVGYNMS